MKELDKILSNLSDEQKEKLVSLLQSSMKDNKSDESSTVDEDFRVTKIDKTNINGRRRPNLD